MLARVWILLLTVLLVAAPVDGVSGEIVDAQVCSECCDDSDLAETMTPASARSREPSSLSALRDHALSPAPVLAGVFRPPRHAFG